MLTNTPFLFFNSIYFPESNRQYESLTQVVQKVGGVNATVMCEVREGEKYRDAPSPPSPSALTRAVVHAALSKQAQELLRVKEQALVERERARVELSESQAVAIEMATEVAAVTSRMQRAAAEQQR